jgi:hypothetical protein
LDLPQARFNYFFWGMAHKECSAKAVLPPTFRPSLDPNEVLKQITALCAHLAKLSGGFPIPQILPGAAREAPPLPMQAEREEKTQAAASGMVMDEDTQRKRATPPPPTPNTTASPMAKQPRKDEVVQARKRYPRPPRRMMMQKVDPYGSDQDEDAVKMTNTNTWREFTLQEHVKKGGGKAQMHGTKGSQWRRVEGEFPQSRELQMARSQYHKCELVLMEWKKSAKFVCHNCEETYEKPVDASEDAKKAWICDKDECEDDGFTACLKCVPVILRTEIRTEH